MEQKTKTAEATAQSTGRVISVISTRGAKKVKIAFDGSNWSDLKSVLTKGGTDVEGNKFEKYDLSNMKCVEATNKTTLEHKEAVLPAGDFSLFLMPVKSKSGAGERTEAMATIKSFIEKDGERAKTFFNGDKNYTNKSTSELVNLIEAYKPGTKQSVSKEKAKAISDVVDSVKATAATSDSVSLTEQLEGLTVDEKLTLVISMLSDVQKKLSGQPVLPATPQEAIEVEEKQPSAEDIAQKEKEEKEKKEREEKERKAREEREKDEIEAKELMKGFDDL